MGRKIVYGGKKIGKGRRLRPILIGVSFFLLFLLLILTSQWQWFDRLKSIIISEELEAFVQQWIYD